MANSPLCARRRDTLWLAVCCALTTIVACGDDGAGTGPTDPEDGGVGDASDTNDTADAGTPDVTVDIAQDLPEDYDCSTFAVAVTSFFSLPLRSHRIEASGGSTAYRFSFDSNNSDAIIDSTTGMYLSGAMGGTTDVVLVEDLACGRSATVSIDVVVEAQIRPHEPTVEPGTDFCFSIEGGSGTDGSWERVRGESGDSGGLDDQGCYTAGSFEGIDLVRYTDGATNQIVETAVVVTNDIAPVTATVPALMLPAQQSFPVAAMGGSGVFTFDTGGNGTIEPDPEAPDRSIVFTAPDTPGASFDLVISDEFSGSRSATVPVVVMSMATHPAIPYGHHGNDFDIDGVGDINGDGIDDFVISRDHASINSRASGAAFVYLGRTNDGPATEPSQVIVGTRRDLYLGRSVTSGEFTGDGCRDVVIGVWGASPAGTRSGEVQIWRGCSDEPPPLSEVDAGGRAFDNVGDLNQTNAPLSYWRALAGFDRDDRYGWDVEVGDFNGDGLDDLAVSAPRAASPDWPGLSEIGRVYIHLGDVEVGLRELPDITLDGVIVGADGMPAAAPDLELGHRLAAGDVNGDGCSDLLVGAGTAVGNNGFANLYLSAPSEEGCRLTDEPALSILPDEEDLRRESRLGWDVAMGDLNGDCLADLAVTQWYAPLPGGPNTPQGAANVFLGKAEWSAENPAFVARTTADVIVYGDNWDQFGWSVDIGDVTADGVADLLVGGRYAEADGTANNVGEVRIYPGTATRSCRTVPSGNGPSIVTDPVIVTNVPERAEDQFGSFVAHVGDVDGDGMGDWVSYAPFGPGADESAATDRLGRALWHRGRSTPATAQLTPLAFPTVNADDEFGAVVQRVGDINGDGFVDYLATAWRWDRPDNVSIGGAGGAWLYFGGGDGMRATPDMRVSGHTHHTGDDWFGYSASAAGDFDGDGNDDFAVSSWLEDTRADNYCVPCRGASDENNAGAVYIYRGGSGFTGRYDGPLEDLPVENTPDFVLCGPERDSRIGRQLVGGFDEDADGLDDLLIGNASRNSSRGAVWVVNGRAFSGSGPDVVCMADGPDLLGEGVANSDLIGWSTATMDVNGDGCDDMISGAYGADPRGDNGAGQLDIWFGAGGPGCPATRWRVTIQGQNRGDDIGYGLAAPGDVDGDGVGDLVVGSVSLGNTGRGAVTIIDGGALRSQLGAVTSNRTLVLSASLTLAVIYEPTDLSGTRFGLAIAGIGSGDDGLADFVVGSELSAASGVTGSGAAYVFRGSGDVAELRRPDVVVGGTTVFTDGYFGHSAMGGPVRTSGGGANMLAIGAPFMEREGPREGELGAVFIGTLP